MNYRDMSYEEFYNNVMSKIEDPLNDENLSKIVYMHKSDNKILLSGDHRFDFSSVFEDDIMTPEHSLSVKFVAYDYSSKAKFSDIFLKKCKERKLPIAIQDSSDCWYVIHSDTEKLPIYLEILEEIGREYPDIKEKVEEPPLIVGKINEWIGYISCPNDYFQSYYEIHADIVNRVVSQKLDEWEENGEDRSNLYKNSKFLEEVRREIKKATELDDIDDYNFAFKKDTKEKFLNLDHSYKVTNDFYSQLNNITSKKYNSSPRKKTLSETISHYYNYLKDFAKNAHIEIVYRNTNNSKDVDNEDVKLFENKYENVDNEDVKLLEDKYNIEYDNNDVLRLENKYDIEDVELSQTKKKGPKSKINNFQIDSVFPNVSYHLVKDEIIQDLPIYSKQKSRWQGVMTDQEIKASQLKIRKR